SGSSVDLGNNVNWTGFPASGASRIAFIAQPTTTTPGSTFSPAVQVALCDAQGNVVPSASDSITLSLQNANGATLGGTLTQATSNGVATFANLSVNDAGLGYSLLATSTSLGNAASRTFNVGNHGQAAQLDWIVQPGPGATNAIQRPPVPTVRIEDAFGDPA